MPTVAPCWPPSEHAANLAFRGAATFFLRPLLLGTFSSTSARARTPGSVPGRIGALVAPANRDAGNGLRIDDLWFRHRSISPPSHARIGVRREEPAPADPETASTMPDVDRGADNWRAMSCASAKVQLPDGRALPCSLGLGHLDHRRIESQRMDTPTDEPAERRREVAVAAAQAERGHRPRPGMELAGHSAPVRMVGRSPASRRSRPAWARGRRSG